MHNTLFIIDDENSHDLIMGKAGAMTFKRYLHDYPRLNERKTRIINLCSTKRHLSKGYYCSLLAEARKHDVLPSVKTINEFRSTNTIKLPLSENKVNLENFDTCKDYLLFFGRTEYAELKKIGIKLFTEYQAPILKIRVINEEKLQLIELEDYSYADLSSEQKYAFIQILNEYTLGVWKLSNNRKQYRWEMAILTNAEEKMPPSNKEAIQRFIKAASKYGIYAQAIEHHQIQNINQFDSLFLRETTAINHHTYQLASQAEKNGLIVIDDPTSILRCCNKVYLHDAFGYQGIPSLKTEVVTDAKASTLKNLEQIFNYPLILKMPESSFSKGVFKVNDQASLKLKLEELLKSSSLILAQEYLYTDYDWRIGVLNNRVIYACRYYMVNSHWQIYRHTSKRSSSGKFETIPTFEVPKSVIDAALKSSNIIGNGLYGVDIKVYNDQAFVIEVNDNPNIDHKVEDLYLGNELYMQIIGEFNRRLELRGR